MSEVKVERTKPVKLACVSHYGGYDAIPLDVYIHHLYQWAGNAHVEAGREPMAILYDCPNETPSWRCRSDVGIPVRGDVDATGEVHVKELPAMEVMAYRYDGPASECPGKHKVMHAWLEAHGYEKVGPAMQVYLEPPEEKDDRLVVHAKVQAPIRKKHTRARRR